VDLRIENANRVADSINATGGRAVGYSGDLSKAAAVADVFGNIDAEFARIDILINAISAPVNRFHPEDFALDEWQTMLDSNLTSYFLCAQAAARIMMRAGNGRNGGSIVNFGSIAGVSALGRGNLAYAVAKGGVMQLTRELAYAWANRNIRVNTVLPCQFVNQMWSSALVDEERTPVVDRVLSGLPLGRMGVPSEIVGPVLFLASDASSMVTGVALPVDGGNLAMNPGASLEW
jgi:2-deoxy-D-gluconate 3-dehydrogenase